MLKQLLRLTSLLWLLLLFPLFGAHWLGELWKSPLIAFLSEHERNTDLFLGDSESGLNLMMTTTRSHEEAPSWSSDGRYLAFDLWDEPDGAVWLLDTNDWTTREITLEQFTQVFWYSPNELIVASNRRGTLFILNIESRTTRPYSEASQCENCVNVPVLGGNWLTAYDLQLSIMNDELSVWINRDTYVNTAMEPNTDLQPWSPDRQYFLFITALQGQPDIYLSAAEGGIARRLTNTPTPEQTPRWSADGQKISYVSYEDGNPEVYVMELATGYRYNLSRHDTRDYAAIWQPFP